MSRILNFRNSTLNRDVLHNNKINKIILSLLDDNYQLNKDSTGSISIIGQDLPDQWVTLTLIMKWIVDRIPNNYSKQFEVCLVSTSWYKQ